MFTPSWLSDKSLMTSLLQEPWRWQAAQALRVLGHIPRALSRDGTIQVTWGFHSEIAWHYPCAELCRVSRTVSGWQLVSTQPALNGYYGVLPYVYQDLEKRVRLASDNSDDSHCILGLFSIFNDRILKHTNQITLDSNITVLFEQKTKRRAKGELTLGHQLLVVAGVPSPKTIPVNNLVRYAAVLGRKTTNLTLLELILRDYFSLNFLLGSAPLEKMPVSPDCRTQLHGRVAHRTRCVGRLGEGCLLGDSCYLLNTCVFVVIVINTREEYQSITHDRKLSVSILEMCSIYFANLVKFRLQIRCPLHCLPVPQLSATPTCRVARLGRLSNLRSVIGTTQRVTMDFPEIHTGEDFSP